MATNLEKGLVVALIATIIVAAAVILAMSWTIHTTGKIKAVGVGVYWDLNATMPCTAIDWGVLGPGDLAGVTVYIKNIKNTNATLTINSTAYVPPEFEKYATLTWNYTGAMLQPAQTIGAQISLLIAPNIANVTTFSFDIYIWAIEA